MDDKDTVDDEEDTKIGKRSEDDEPCWVMDTSTQTVRHHMASVRQKLMWLEELTQLGGGDVTEDIWVRDMDYVMAKLKVPAAVKPQTHNTTATTSPATFGQHI